MHVLFGMLGLRLVKFCVAAAAIGPGIVSAQDEKLLNASYYDYIIVGGGTSGLTVANRLTENGKSELMRP